MVNRANVRAIAEDCECCQLSDSGAREGSRQGCVAKLSDLLTPYSIQERGRTVFNQGEPVTHIYFLCKGLVKLSAVTAGGDEVVLDVLPPCSMIGALPTKNNATHDYTAVTLSEMTVLYCLDVKDLLRQIFSDPSLAFALVRRLSTRLNQAYMTLVDMKLPVGDRLIATLARLANLTDEKAGTKPTKLPLSCREIAQLAQTTPETLSRLLHPHQQKGIIRVEKGLWVLDKRALDEHGADYRGEDALA